MKSRTAIKGPEESKRREEYLSKTEYLLKQKRGDEALLILKHALKEMPEDPFILSYYGCLVAIVDKKASQGAKICKEVIEMVKRSQPLGEFIRANPLNKYLGLLLSMLKI